MNEYALNESEIFEQFFLQDVQITACELKMFLLPSKLFSLHLRNFQLIFRVYLAGFTFKSLTMAKEGRKEE